MIRRRIAGAGDVYWIDPNPIAGREIRDRHRFVIITQKEINALGVAMAVPVTGGGAFARNMGLTVAISGHDTLGVAEDGDILLGSGISPKVFCDLRIGAFFAAHSSSSIYVFGAAFGAGLFEPREIYLTA